MNHMAEASGHPGRSSDGCPVPAGKGQRHDGPDLLRRFRGRASGDRRRRAVDARQRRDGDVIWETFLETMTRNGSLGMGLGMVGVYGDDGTDTALQKAAAPNTATDGAAEPRPLDSSRSSESSIGTTTSPPTSLPWRTTSTPT